MYIDMYLYMYGADQCTQHWTQPQGPNVLNNADVKRQWRDSVRNGVLFHREHVKRLEQLRTVEVCVHI